MTSDLINDPVKYLRELEKLLKTYENSIIGEDPEVKEWIKEIRSCNDVNFHWEYLNKITKKMLEKYDEMK
jgi:hypothetical protein